MSAGHVIKTDHAGYGQFTFKCSCGVSGHGYKSRWDAETAGLNHAMYARLGGQP